MDIILSGSGERISLQRTPLCKVGRDEWKMRFEERVPQYLSVSPEDICCCVLEEQLLRPGRKNMKFIKTVGSGRTHYAMI